MPIRAVVFDLFDTVVDLHMDQLPEFKLGDRTQRGTTGLLHQAVSEFSGISIEDFSQTVRSLDKEKATELTARGFEYPTYERFQNVCLKLELPVEPLAQTLTDIHMTGIYDCASYLEHHVEVLEALRRSTKTAICSNFSYSPTALKVLGASKLLPHFDAISISDAVGFRKPRPEIFHATLRELGVDAGEALHVGDRLDADVSGAVGVGMIPVWITRRVSEPEARLADHAGPEPHHVIEDLSELLRIVDA